MSAMVLSADHQITLPPNILKAAGIEAGALLEIICYGNRIEIIPIQPMKNLKGIFKGMDTTIVRDRDYYNE